MSIYKPGGIRGEAAGQLRPEMYEAWGRALGLRLPQGAKFLVGGDVRDSTPAFLSALESGLCRAGLDVVNVGFVPTPMVYYACHRLHADGCAIVTASHSPASVNGLKWMIGDRLALYDMADLERAQCQPAEGTDGRRQSAPRGLDISFDYVAHLQETFVDALATQCHVVLDPMHGCWASRVRRYLHAIFPQCFFSVLHDSVEADFAGRAPDCARQSGLAELCDAVYRERAHLGIAFDGDGDCLALVDNDGVILSPEETAWVLLQCLGDKLSGERFVYDLKFSDRIPEAARRLGAEPLAERSGHGFLRARMREADALLGADLSGHYFHRALNGGDDALYTACLLVAYLARTGRPLARLRATCPAIYITPDLRVPAPPDRQREVLEGVSAAWNRFPQRSLDGVRIDVPGGWALVRPSVTEPALTFRFEGLDWHALEDLVKRFCDGLPPETGELLWRQYRTAMGLDEP